MGFWYAGGLLQQFYILCIYNIQRDYKVLSRRCKLKYDSRIIYPFIFKGGSFQETATEN